MNMDKFAVQKSLEQAKNSLAQKDMQAAIKYAKQVAWAHLDGKVVYFINNLNQH